MILSTHNGEIEVGRNYLFNAISFYVIATSCEFSGSDGKFVIVDTEKLFGYSYKKK